ncbi:hypothetical protein AUEXF2481DRAFT_43185 [Aureobasidium subglaciale EXF-2481]|uniref:Uncharacterized protein n=1 Tax=Aureobasidium subglaciale (strain EXF-2481) TaxID=1043005 RepID=A0A074Y3V2_AURSE|nr:uncharacterized protein AUEXF2481DRAFT_43185 [Aureobasidium subglaciale EXF-2481]KEQ92395.1 hypothetical protein AUEXF2481DRAFT_43185 [Aureobasidium subglaciale EXF-2481]
MCQQANGGWESNVSWGCVSPIKRYVLPCESCVLHYLMDVPLDLTMRVISHGIFEGTPCFLVEVFERIWSSHDELHNGPLHKKRILQNAVMQRLINKVTLADVVKNFFGPSIDTGLYCIIDYELQGKRITGLGQHLFVNKHLPNLMQELQEQRLTSQPPHSSWSTS